MTSVRRCWIAVVALAVSLGPVVAAPPAGLKGAGDDADRWLLDNADFVTVLNVKQLASAESIKKGGADALKELLTAEPRVAALFEAAGIAPLEDIGSVLFSGSVAKGETRGVVVVRGKFDPDKAFAAAKQKADKVETLTEDGVPMLKLKVQGHDAFAAFVGKDVLVLTQSKATTATWVKTGGKTEAKISPAMKSALGAFDGTETLTFVVVLNDDLRKSIARVPQLAVAGSKLQTITASLKVSTQADLVVVAGTSEPRAAKQVLSALNTLKSLAEVLVSEESFGSSATEILNEMKLGISGTDVKLTLKVDKALVEKASKKTN